MIGGSNVASLTSSLGRDTTLTGRTGIWAGLLPVIERQPILGYGFGSFWTTKRARIHEINEAHNGYIDVLLEIGYVGLFLFTMFLLSSCPTGPWALVHNFDWASLLLCFLIMAVIHNVAETSINSFTSHLTAVLLFLAVSSSADSSYTQGFTRSVKFDSIACLKRVLIYQNEGIKAAVDKYFG